jgi:hypothetical protein
MRGTLFLTAGKAAGSPMRGAPLRQDQPEVASAVISLTAWRQKSEI